MILKMNTESSSSVNKLRIFSFPTTLLKSADKLKENKLVVSIVNGKAATATICAALIVFVNLLSSPAFAAVGEGSLLIFEYNFSI